MRKSHSRSREGTDETRAPGPAPDDPRPAPPQNEATEGQGQSEGEGGRRRRRRRRKPNEAQSESLSPDSLPRAEASSAQPAAQGPESSEPKKSRSKRRRERRAEAKARGSETLPHAEGAIRPELGGKAEQAQPPRPEPSRPEGHRAEFKSKSGDRRDRGFKEGRGNKSERPPRQQRERPPFEGRDNRSGPQGGPGSQSRPLRPSRPEHGPSSGAGAQRPPEYTRRTAPLPAPLLPFEAEDDGLELPPGISGFDAQGRPVFSRQARVDPRKKAPASRILETLAASAESLAVLERLAAAIDEASPLQAKHRAGLRGDIRKLWEDLTSDREHRSVDYLGTPPALSAYLRYFLPWNVYRLVSILSNADFCLPDNAVIVDIGSGPLTFPIALWASRPELREVPLTIYCVDRVERVLEAGLAVFETLCMRVAGTLPPWRFELRKDSFGAPLPERAHLLAAANVFNEFFWREKNSLGERALDTARTLLGYLKENGSLFVMEPGDPRSGAFISSLRAALIAEGASPLGPCPHALSCPMPGIFRHLLPPEATRSVKGDPNSAPSRFILAPVTMPKNRDKFPWCHFGIDTDKAPAALRAISEEAGLPKERAVLSYLWAARGILARPVAGPAPLNHSSEKERRTRAGRGILVRVISEPFGLPEGSTGQYACSNLGYTLLRRPRGEEAFEPGDLLEVQAAPLQKNDEKSGALILPA